MKSKIFSLAFIAIILSSTGYAQRTLKPHLGVNYTSVNLSGSDADITGKAGVLGGISLAFGKKFYFEPGVQYVAKSTDVVNALNPDLPDGNYDLTGIRVPLALGLNLLGDDKSTITLHGFAGGAAFFVTGDNYDDHGIDINKTNWSVFAGLGVYFWKVFLDASYEWSLTEISGDVEAGKTNSVYVTAGFRFSL